MERRCYLLSRIVVEDEEAFLSCGGCEWSVSRRIVYRQPREDFPPSWWSKSFSSPPAVESSDGQACHTYGARKPAMAKKPDLSVARQLQLDLVGYSVDSILTVGTVGC